jgi:hypothetical protein
MKKRRSADQIMGWLGEALKIKVWPKLFQNLRSSRESELIKVHGMEVACAWIGNTPAVAMKHYLQITD